MDAAVKLEPPDDILCQLDFLYSPRHDEVKKCSMPEFQIIENEVKEEYADAVSSEILMNKEDSCETKLPTELIPEFGGEKSGIGDSFSNSNEHVNNKKAKHRLMDIDRLVNALKSRINHPTSSSASRKKSRIKKQTEQKTKCAICCREFEKSAILSHKKTGPTKYFYQCDVCKKNFFHEKTVELHVKVHGKYSENITPVEIKTEYHGGRLIWFCDQCDMTSFSGSYLLGHLNTLHSKSPNPDDVIQCNHCHLYFPSELLLFEHLKKLHGDVMSHNVSSNSVPECGDYDKHIPYQVFLTHFQLMSSAHKVKDAKRPIDVLKKLPNSNSGINIQDIKIVKWTAKEHQGGTECSYTSRVPLKHSLQKKTRDSSVKMHSGTNNNLAQVKTTEDNVVRKTPFMWKCLLCKLFFDSQSNMLAHSQRAHRVTKNTCILYIPQCGTCDLFIVAAEFCNQTLIDKLPACSRIYSTYNSYGESFFCPLCWKFAGSTSVLITHMNKTHRSKYGEKTLCHTHDECSSSSSSAGCGDVHESVKKSVQNLTTFAVIFRCRVCKRFQNQASKHRHVGRKTGIPDHIHVVKRQGMFSCPVCGVVDCSLRLMVAHMNFKHLQSDPAYLQTDTQHCSANIRKGSAEKDVRCKKSGTSAQSKHLDETLVVLVDWEDEHNVKVSSAVAEDEIRPCREKTVDNTESKTSDQQQDLSKNFVKNSEKDASSVTLTHSIVQQPMSLPPRKKKKLDYRTLICGKQRKRISKKRYSSSMRKSEGENSYTVIIGTSENDDENTSYQPIAIAEYGKNMASANHTEDNNVDTVVLLDIPNSEDIITGQNYDEVECFNSLVSNGKIEHHGGFWCENCQACYENLQVLTSHDCLCDKTEKDDLKLICVICGLKFSLCHFCGEQFSSDMKIEHLRMHHQEHGGQCTICHANLLEFPLSHILQEHDRLEPICKFCSTHDYKISKRYSCERCDRKFTSKLSPAPSFCGNCRKLVSRNNSPRLYKCGECPAVFERQDTAFCHKKYLCRGKKFRCKVCSILFARQCTLFRHIKFCHRPKVKTEFQCAECKKCFFSKGSWQWHNCSVPAVTLKKRPIVLTQKSLLLDHRDSSPHSESEKMRLRRRVRLKRPANHTPRSDLKPHNNIQPEAVNNATTISEKSTFSDHKNASSHSESGKVTNIGTKSTELNSQFKKYDCKKCGRKYQSMLTPAPKFCRICRIFIPRKKRGRLFKCRTCSEVFKRNDTADHHKKYLCNGKEFRCVYCRELFTLQCALSRHVKVCHRPTPKKKVRCPKCKRYFQDERTQKLHQKLRGQCTAHLKGTNSRITTK